MSLDLLSNVQPLSKFPPHPIRKIIRDVAARYKILPELILGEDRTWPILAIRHEAMYVAFNETAYSLTQIGRHFKRDHSTVMSGVCSHCVRNDLPLPRGAQWVRQHRIRTLPATRKRVLYYQKRAREMTIEAAQTKPGSNITDDDKLACAKRELHLREKVYPRWVKNGQMGADKAEHELAVMRAIVRDYEIAAAQARLPL